MLLSISLRADQIKIESLACPALETFKKVPSEALEDDLKLSLFAVAHDCRVLSHSDHVTAIGYDPRNEKSIYIQILHKKSGETLFIRRKNILIEQPGKKNQFRF